MCTMYFMLFHGDWNDIYVMYNKILYYNRSKKVCHVKYIYRISWDKKHNRFLILLMISIKRILYQDQDNGNKTQWSNFLYVIGFLSDDLVTCHCPIGVNNI